MRRFSVALVSLVAFVGFAVPSGAATPYTSLAASTWACALNIPDPTTLAVGTPLPLSAGHYWASDSFADGSSLQCSGSIPLSNGGFYVTINYGGIDYEVYVYVTALTSQFTIPFTYANCDQNAGVCFATTSKNVGSVGIRQCVNTVPVPWVPGVCTFYDGQTYSSFPSGAYGAVWISGTGAQSVAFSWVYGGATGRCSSNSILGASRLLSSYNATTLLIATNTSGLQFVVQEGNLTGLASTGNFRSTYSLHGKTFSNAWMGSTEENTSYSLQINADGAGLNQLTTQDLRVMELWCFNGAWHDMGNLLSTINSLSSAPQTPAGTILGGGSAVDPNSCLSGFGWNPVTDTVGIFQAFFCYVRYLVEPGYQVADGYGGVAYKAGIDTSSAVDALKTHVPFSWITGAASAVVNLANGFSSAASTGDICDAPSFSPFSNGTLQNYFHNTGVNNWTVNLPVARSCPNYVPGTSGFVDLWGFKSVIYFLEELALSFLALRLALRFFGFTKDFEVSPQTNEPAEQ